MKSRKFRFFRRMYGISLSCLAQSCGISEQRMSELELSEIPVAQSTVEKIQLGFERIIERRQLMLLQMREDYNRNRQTLLEPIEEYEYEL